MLADHHVICKRIHKTGSRNEIGLQLHIYGTWKIGWKRKLVIRGLVGFEIRLGFVFGLKIACKQKC